MDGASTLFAVFSPLLFQLERRPHHDNKWWWGSFWCLWRFFSLWLAVTALLNQASWPLLIKNYPLDTWPWKPSKQSLFWPFYIPFSSCASETSRELVCSWCTIDKVILDALLRDLLQHFPRRGKKKYEHIHIFEIFLIPAIFVSELNPTDWL